MILKGQKLGAFELIEEINVDGIEMDIGAMCNRNTLNGKRGNQEEVREFLGNRKRQMWA